MTLFSVRGGVVPQSDPSDPLLPLPLPFEQELLSKKLAFMPFDPFVPDLGSRPVFSAFPPFAPTNSALPSASPPLPPLPPLPPTNSALPSPLLPFAPTAVLYAWKSKDETHNV